MMTLYLMSPWEVLATPFSMLRNWQLLTSSAPSSQASLARYWSKRSRSVVYPVWSRTVTFPLGSMSLIPMVSRQRSSFGMSKSDSPSVRLGNMSWISSRLGMNSPHLTGTPTSGRFSIIMTLAPDRAANLAAVLPAGPEPTTRTSTSFLSIISPVAADDVVRQVDEGILVSRIGKDG